jgi:hypothetical protein
MKHLGLRVVTAAAVLLSGAVHPWLWWVDGFRNISWIGPLFLLNAVAGLVIAIAVLAWPHWLPPLVAAGFGASTLGAFLLSTTVGLFGIQEVFWGGPQVLAMVAEVVAIVCGLALVLRTTGLRPSRRGAPQRSGARARKA